MKKPTLKSRFFVPCHLFPALSSLFCLPVRHPRYEATRDRQECGPSPVFYPADASAIDKLLGSIFLIQEIVPDDQPTAPTKSVAIGHTKYRPFVGKRLQIWFIGRSLQDGIITDRSTSRERHDREERREFRTTRYIQPFRYEISLAFIFRSDSHTHE